MARKNLSDSEVIWIRTQRGKKKAEDVARAVGLTAAQSVYDIWSRRTYAGVDFDEEQFEVLDLKAEHERLGARLDRILKSETLV